MKPYFEKDGITIYHGDCREILPHVQADVMVTDPPYGISYEVNWNRSVERPRSIAGDDSTASRDEVLASIGDMPAIVFGSWKSTRPKKTKMVLVWEKMGSAGMGDLSLPWRPNIEEVYVIGGGFRQIAGRESSVLRFNALCGDQWHPHQKPVSLLSYLIDRCPEGVVVDPFVGCGTTLRAAMDLGRRAIGIEIEERYCEIAAKRLAQGVLFT